MISLKNFDRTYDSKAGRTWVQVTHSEDNAAYGDRIIRLRDGWMD